MSPYLNFRGTFANSGGHSNSFCFLPVKLETVFRKFLFILFKFELDVDSFGLRRDADYSEVVSTLP